MNDSPNLSPNRSPNRSLGRTELVDLPQLQCDGANAVIDSGAYHCAIHCINFHRDGDALMVTWQSGTVTRHEQFRKVTVKSSFGDRQERYLIYLHLRVYGEDFNQEFSLSDRSRMRNPLLLGRTFLKRGFVVNVRRRNSSAKYLSRTIPPSPAAP